MRVPGYEEDELPADDNHEQSEEEHARQVSSWKDLPWWRRPSPYWLVFGSPFGSIGFAALLAPKVALYTTLACRVHRPEYISNDLALSFPFASNFVTIPSVDLPIPHVYDNSKVTLEPVYVHLPYSASLDYTQDDSDSEQKCASDPVVQATAARLSAGLHQVYFFSVFLSFPLVFATFLGIFACLTTGWWSSLSDRYGRRVALFASVFGLFVTDATHVITAWFVDVLPGGYWFPLVGSFIEGLCGGMPTGVAMFHTYLADTTDPSTRSRYFALALGVMYSGAAVGPVLGGLLIRSTGNLLSVFYFSTILHGIYATLILFVLPESLTPARARGARLRRSQEKANQVSGNRVFDVLKSSTRFFSPLLVLLPERLPDPKIFKQKRDWSLFFVAIAYALVTNTESVAPYKFQYAAAQFHWTPEITSYYVSSVSVSRALFLAVILPLIIKYFKPAPIQLPSTSDEPLRGHSSSLPAPSLTSSPQNDSDRRLPASPSAVFDLILARTSAVLQSASYLGLAIANTGALFTLTSVISAFSAGFSPAAQALALDIYARNSKNRGEVGKLYGALSVMQVLAQIVTPALYGFVYAKTVSVFPQAIMVVSVCMTLLALVLLSFVRISSGSPCERVVSEDGSQGHGRTVTCETLGGEENGVVGER